MLQAAFNYPAEQVKAPYSLLAPPPAPAALLGHSLGGSFRTPLLSSGGSSDARSCPPFRAATDPQPFVGENGGQTALFHSTDKKSGWKRDFFPPRQAPAPLGSCGRVGKHVLVAGPARGLGQAINPVVTRLHRPSSTAVNRRQLGAQLFLGCK